MTSQSWSHASYPEDSWSTHFVQDTGARPQSYGSDWRGHVAPATTQDKMALDASAWMNMPPGTVDLGLSPVLSHESQSSHTLNSFSELDIPVLPPSLDLSFAEATWNPPAPSKYENSPQDTSPAMSRLHCVSAAPGAQAFHDPRPSGGFTMAQQYHTPVDYQAYSAQGTQDAQAFYQQPTLYFPPATHHRPLLPRTEPAAVPSQATHGPQRAIRPNLSVPQGSDASVHSVSTVAGQNQEMSQHALAPTAGLHQPNSPVLQRLPSGPVTGETTSHMPPDFAVHSQPVGPVGYLSDRTEDWTSFIHFDQEDTVSPPGPTRSESPPPSLKRHQTDPIFSYPTGYSHVPAMPAAPPMSDANVVDSSFSQDNPAATYGMPVAAPAPAETDEGRHRSHPLYNEGPSADGLYHCPYEKEPHCQHKPTKLKCNYDKFIDSHLKPFRCKIEACAKQEFSSTACLLRHEREAHGMHGHGDRPHLCYYPGCERGIPGNGFPRRYNLFDHMKRVHDHKEDSTSLTASPGPANDASNSRRPGGRKRKASGPSSTEPPAQRQKPLPSPPAQAPPAAALQRNTSYPAPAPTSSAHQNDGQSQHHNRARKLHDRQRLYSQWANQRDLLTHQMGFVQSPDDEAHLLRLSQNLEELRRLSQEARRG
ncbi:hypothetical protein D0862_10147 [Hortaea werneckii]|uniref:C2H2-type domain-containing protein n=1 Tax=Hortaea werneckii TaxID=91943 RepID=A0A3M7FLB6_HORWE|nr:hypothetical protein D0862_10147 [Hortaea werneckii]